MPNLDELVIVTDMDGCFIDHNTYGYEDSFPAYVKAVESGVPVCFCTSKGVTEIEPYNDEISDKLGVKIAFPFVAENGSAVYLPKNYFDLKDKKFKSAEKYDIIELNCSQQETMDMLLRVREKMDFSFIIFTEMTPEELHEDCGLSIEAAKRARIKYYANGCKIPDETPEKVAKFKEAVFAEGFTHSKGGRYHGVNKGADKGKATRILLDLYKENGRTFSIGLGDSGNDIPMLNEVDKAYLVKKHNGTHQEIDNDKIMRVPLIGPKGWNVAVMQHLVSN